ncbi:MAG TPA: hypothetical protein VHS96_05010 [Bacteroidia bacterium]|nr:hypothetical protein [Bacteroidia bacterium]
MKKHSLKFAALATCMLIFVTSCQKESVEGDDSQISASQTSSDAGGMVEQVEDEAAYRMSPSTAITGCPTITWSADRGTFPNTCTIDFGTSCTGRNGRVFSGQITVDVSAPYFEAGSVRVTQTDNLTIDGNSLAFTRTVTNLGLNPSDQMHWSVVVNGTRVKASDGSEATWTANRVRTMTAGLETEDNLEDDIHEITGSATGVSHRGDAFTSTITTPLVKRGDCQWIVSGIEVTTAEGRRGERTLDFGDGSCDDKGTITLRNGDTREITLHRPRR